MAAAVLQMVAQRRQRVAVLEIHGVEDGVGVDGHEAQRFSGLVDALWHGHARY